MNFKNYNLTNCILFFILLILLVNSTFFSCSKIYLNNFLKLLTCSSCNLNFDFGITKDKWYKNNNLL